MSVKESAIRLVLKAKDALSAPVRASAKSLEAFKAEAESLKKKFSTLEKQDGLLSAFQKQTAAVRDSKKAYKEAESQVERLAKEYQQSDKPTKAMTKSLNAARQSVIKSNTAYQKQRKKLTDLRTGLNQAGLSSRDIAKQQKKLAAEMKKTAAAYEKVNGKAKLANKTLRSNALKNAAKSANKASRSFNLLSQRLVALAAAAFGLHTIKRGIEGILSTGDMFERLQVQLNAVMGSIEGGQTA